VNDYHEPANDPTDAPELTLASTGAPAGRPGGGRPAEDGDSLVPAQDGYRRLIMQAGVRAGSTSWMAHGACHRSDPELFFPIAAAGSAAEQTQVSHAKAVCGSCEVGRKCLSYALRTMPHGIWGGTTREERIAIRARAVARSSRQGQS
jgi:WhiB family transcriptional regulator, redox-sensing transcriptional regulator